jgi:hypothetical protein
MTTPTSLQLEQMIGHLDEMTPKTKAPGDNLGKFLGDGLPSEFPPLRTYLLSESLKELLAIRNERTASYAALTHSINQP